MARKKIHFLIGGDFKARKYFLKSYNDLFKYCFVYEHSYYTGCAWKVCHSCQQGEKYQDDNKKLLNRAYKRSGIFWSQYNRKGVISKIKFNI